jgi:phosphotransferase system enzyme I (PtsI)/phosphotransferase system enzyme I (PtsP)
LKMSNSQLFELTQILQKAGLADNLTQQVQMIVDGISKAIGVDVCSLYRKTREGELALLASHGLNANHPVVIPKGRGIVGRVIKTKSIINLIEPDKQSDYYHINRSQEESFNSFCGVPLVHYGEVIGALVVQRSRAELISAEQEALLLTLSLHLAILVNNLPERLDQKQLDNCRSEGISGAQGIAIGRVALREELNLSDAPENPCTDIQIELQEWERIKIATGVELDGERNQVKETLGDAMAAVLDAYQKFLYDPSFHARIESEIVQGKSLPWAIKQTVHYFSEQFLAMDDPYLSARHEDIEHLGDKLYHVWCGNKPKITALEGNKSPLVLVGNQISVSDIVSLPSAQLKAIVCRNGAALSHIAIFANALGIPAVMGIGEFSVQEGETVIVDGDQGQIFSRPSQALLQEYQKLIDERENTDRELLANAQLPAVSLDGQVISLLANSGLQADIMPSLRNGADGVGLYRTEIPFMIRQSLPSEDEQVQVYEQLVKAFSNKPVYFRTLDIGGDKPLPYLPETKEDNPALGLRGVRFTLSNQALFLTQIRAIIRAAENRSNIHLLLPMVSSTQELDSCIELVNEACSQLQAEGFQVMRPKVGIMAEVPSVVSMLPFWRKKLDFISIGSNDLSQYLLAIDRNNPLVSKFYDVLHPAIIMELKRIVDTAKHCELPLSLCGQMASDPISLFLLLGMGVRQFSMSSSKIPYCKSLIRSLDLDDARKLLNAVLMMDSADKIRQEGTLLLESISQNNITLDRIYLINDKIR